MARARKPSSPRFIDPAALRQRLLIDTTSGPRLLSEVIEPWQAADFEALDPAWRRVMGQRVPEAKMLAYLERPRGHSKTTDIAVMAATAAVGTTKQGVGYFAAGDRDQAKLIRDAVERLVYLNDPLRGMLEVQNYRIVNKVTGTTIEVLSGDAASSFGLTPTLCVIVDELTTFRDGNGEALWQSLFSSQAKTGCLLVVISNAGVGAGSSWQWQIREAARTGDRWHFSSLDGPKASWISEEWLEEQRRILPSLAFDRLWLNRWTTGTSDAITSEDIDAALAAGLPEVTHNNGEWSVCGGLDGGVSRDWAAYVCLGRNRAGRYRVLQVHVWKPPRGGKIDQQQVEETVARTWKSLRMNRIVADPCQLEYLTTRLQKRSVRIETRAQSGKALVEQALATVSHFSSRNIDCPAHSALEYDLRHARIEERSYGLRLVSDHGPQGHGDVLSALSIAAAVAKDLPATGPYQWGGVVHPYANRPDNSFTPESSIRLRDLWNPPRATWRG